MDSATEWVLDVAEDIQVPGWLFVPAELDSAAAEQWIADALDALSAVIGAERWDGETTTETDVREVLQQALDERATSDSLAIFQVWPVPGPAAVMCHVNIVASEALPRSEETDAVMHAVEAPHIGPGVQYSTRETVEGPDGPIEFVSVHYAFDDGEVALALSLEESIAPLISHAIPGFVLLKDVIRMKRQRDGSPFVSKPFGGIVEDAPWPLEG